MVWPCRGNTRVVKFNVEPKTAHSGSTEIQSGNILQTRILKSQNKVQGDFGISGIFENEALLHFNLRNLFFLKFSLFIYYYSSLALFMISWKSPVLTVFAVFLLVYKVA